MLGSISYILGKPLTKSQKVNIRTNKTAEKTQNFTEDEKELDIYIILFFKEDCIYSNGFKNDYRSGISYIINRKNNLKLTSDKALIVQKDFGIEIHFKQAVTDLQFFFSGSVDKNMYIYYLLILQILIHLL